MSTIVYSLMGLRVESAVALPAQIAPAPGPPADLRVCWGAEREIPQAPAIGTVLAELDLGDTGFAVTQSQTGYVIRTYGTCDFSVDPDLSEVSVHRDRTCSEELAALLLSGTALSTVLTLKGLCVIHASAVALEGRQLAFIGPSGQGKSTLAAALCARGAALISDDALRCDVEGNSARCFGGSQSIRLREKAWSLVTVASQREGSLTVDGRCAIEPKLSAAASLVLDGLIAPRTVLEPCVTVTALSGSAALAELARCARIACWMSPNIRRVQFELLAGLARVVPMYNLAIPTRSVFTDEGRAEIVRALGQLPSRQSP